MLLDYMPPEKSVITNDRDEFQNILRAEMATSRFRVALNDLELSEDGTVRFDDPQSGAPKEFPFTQFFLEDVAKHSKIPLSYALTIDFDLFNTNFEQRRTSQSHPIDVAVVGGRAVGLATPVRPAQTIDVVERLGPKFLFQRAVISDRGVEVDYLFDNAAPLEPQPGDIIREGIRLSNSESGGAALKIARFTHRLICSNGMQVAERFGVVRWSYDARVTYGASIGKIVRTLDELVDARRPLDVVYRQSTEARLTEESLANIWRSVQRAGLGAIEADAAMAIDATYRGRIQAASRRRAYEDEPPAYSDRTAFDLHNQVTHYAHSQPHHFRVRSSLERLGGDILSEYSEHLAG